MGNLFKRAVSVLLITMILIPLVSATGITVFGKTYTGSCGNSLTWTLDTVTGIFTVNGTGDMYDYKNNITNGITVPWRDYRSYIRSVEISDSVTSIGAYAFYGCDGLESVSMPDSIKSIGNLAFGGCDLIRDISIPDSVKTIGNSAFSGCIDLTNLSIGSSVEVIGSYAFSNCWGFRDIVIPDSVVSIGNGAFTNTFIKNLTIGNSVKTIGDHAFDNCVMLTSVIIPDSVISIGEHAFYYCTDLQSVTIGNSVESIGLCAFAECYGLDSVIIGRSVKYIDYYAFHYYISEDEYDYGDFLPLDITIHCYKDTYAYDYAKFGGFDCELLCDHVFSSYSYAEPTCTSDAYNIAYCDYGCGGQSIKYIEGTKLPHIWSEQTTYTEPTCTSDAYNIAYCDYGCGRQSIEYIEGTKLPHIWSEQTTYVEPTCTSDAYNISHCEYGCDEQSIEYIEGTMLSHTWSDWKIILEPTNTGEGIEERYCLVCGGRDVETIPMLPDPSRPVITVDNLTVTITDADGIRDLRYAPGVYHSAYRVKTDDNNVAVNNNIIERNTVDGSFVYTMPDVGHYTVWIRMKNGTEYIMPLDVTVADVNDPVFTENGLQVIVSNISDVKVIRTAYGRWNTVKELKASGTLRSFTAKTAIKGSDSYTIQYREEGTVTVIVEYNNGYKKVFHYDVEKKAPVFEQDGNTFTISELDGLKVIRYARGEYATSAEIKYAQGSTAVKWNGPIYTVALDTGTYTFCVQYDDESYNYYTVTVE